MLVYAGDTATRVWDVYLSGPGSDTIVLDPPPPVDIAPRSYVRIQIGGWTDDTATNMRLTVTDATGEGAPLLNLAKHFSVVSGGCT